MNTIKATELIDLAKAMLEQSIELLEVACQGDPHTHAYLIDKLKIMSSDNHGFMSSDLNLDRLAEIYEGVEVNADEDLAGLVDEINQIF